MSLGPQPVGTGRLFFAGGHSSGGSPKEITRASRRSRRIFGGVLLFIFPASVARARAQEGDVEYIEQRIPSVIVRRLMLYVSAMEAGAFESS